MLGILECKAAKCVEATGLLSSQIFSSVLEAKVLCACVLVNLDLSYT